MYQYDDPTAISSMPVPAAAGTPGYFTDGNPGSGQPATLVRADFLNAVMMELLNILSAGGVTPSKTNDGQVLAALQALGLRPALTTQNGVVQLADNPTAQALTDGSRVLTPATLRAAQQGSNQSLSAAGYQKLPGGLIIQWGTLNYGSYTANTTTSSPITFPLAFPNAALSATASPNLGITTTMGFTLEGITKTGMTIRYINGTSVNPLSITWIAVGY